MRIAVPYEDGQIFQHFGHSQRFRVYDVEAGKVKTTAIIDTKGSGHGALAGLLRNAHVDVLICGGIGGGAQQALAQAGIRLYGGVTGDADQAVEDLLANRLAFNPAAVCAHHGEGHHGGSHSCGGHSCT
ncbi:MAG: NifB/NifX family molybdenum-iron cluster-binding protein [Proteobacteria bacterium]|nr:NifB/NifX family molybdenum-iron cluster-binding protein [Pseudomonadota bacterium]